MKKQSIVKRMHHPLDTLTKRQSAYIGDVVHQFHNLPGKYDGPCINEFPAALGAIPEIDMGYFALIDNKRFIINLEDESVKVDEETLLKLDKYKVLLEYAFDNPVISVITTNVADEDCKKILQKSSTQMLLPKIISYDSQKRRKILNTLKTKIKNNKTLSKVDALSLIMLSRGCDKFSDEVSELLNEVCNLLKELKVEDSKFKLELIMEMDCIIHYYAKDEEIAYFERVIGLREVKSAMEYHEEFLINQGLSQGISQGISEGISQGISRGRVEGLFESALKVKNEFGIGEALRLFNFSYDELESEKIDESRFLICDVEGD